jgi:hypothetical protein
LKRNPKVTGVTVDDVLNNIPSESQEAAQEIQRSLKQLAKYGLVNPKNGFSAFLMVHILPLLVFTSSTLFLLFAYLLSQNLSFSHASCISFAPLTFLRVPFEPKPRLFFAFVVHEKFLIFGFF